MIMGIAAMRKDEFRKRIEELNLPMGEWLLPSKVGGISMRNGSVMPADLPTMRFRIGEKCIDILCGSSESIGSMLIQADISYDRQTVMAECIAKNKYGLKTDLPKAGDILLAIGRDGKILATTVLTGTYMGQHQLIMTLASPIGMEPKAFAHSTICYYDPGKVGRFPTLGDGEFGIYMAFTPNAAKRKDYHIRIPCRKISAIRGR